MNIAYSIIIPVYNVGRHFAKTLDSFPKNFKDSFEVIVVDDCSTDETADIIRSHPFYSRIQFLKTPVNSGPAAARNLGAKAARGKYLIFFDADVEFLADTFDELEAYVKKHPSVKCFTGMNAPESLDTGFVSQFHAAYSYYVLSLIPPNGTVSTWNPRIGFIEKDLFLSLGGFDARYRRADVEDYALSKNISKKHKIFFNSSFRIKHRFAGFQSATKNFFKRAIQWTHLFVQTGLPDQTGHTRLSNMPNVLVSCLIGASFPLYLFMPPRPTFALQAGLLALFFVLNFKPFCFFVRTVGLFRAFLYSALIIYYNEVAGLGIFIGFLTAIYKGKFFNS